MASIKFLSRCACVRCLVLKNKFPQLGSKRDMKDRIKLKRFDDLARQEAVAHARKLLFEKGVSITSKRISDILGAKSLVPTHVSEETIFCICSNHSLERILSTLIRTWPQLLRVICCRPSSRV
jgi:hypothetical protein